MTRENNGTKLMPATFAGGCFWCMVQPFQQLDGVEKVISGYTGGHASNPTYEQVCSGTTGHYEAVQVIFNPEKVGYRELLEVFWRQINPTDPGGQFYDRGSQYLTAVFYHDEEQRRLAEASRQALEQSGIFQSPIATRIVKADIFYPAEDYHQDYHIKNTLHYKGYRLGSGRDAYLESAWKGVGMEFRTAPGPGKYAKPPEEELKMKLNETQYRVTQKNATEPPFQNEFWNDHRKGIYVDIASGEPLFSSLDKFDSGCGWPSFSTPLEGENLMEKQDRSHFMERVEVRSKHGDSHLGHVFTEGPAPSGLRYCINSAALRFIPVEDLEKEGYGQYAKRFAK